jgi:hypothetical protein
VVVSGGCCGLVGATARVTGPGLLGRVRQIRELVEEVQHAPFLVQDGLRYQAGEKVVEAGARLRVVVAGDCSMVSLLPLLHMFASGWLTPAANQVGNVVDIRHN